MSTLLRLGKLFEFEAAHHLPHHEGHCREVHGHSYKLEVVIEGDPQIMQGAESGMIMDLKTLKNIVHLTVVDDFDHSNLNMICDNPTAENLVLNIVDRLQSGLINKGLDLVKVKLWETSSGYAEWRRSDQE